MNSSIYMAFSNIKKRKLQSSLIALTIIASVMLLSTALSIIMNTQDIFGKASKDFKTSQLYIYPDSKYQPMDEALSYWKGKKGVSVRAINYFPYSGNLKLGKDELVTGLAITGFDGFPKEQDKMILVEGKKSKNKRDYVGEGEIWLPTGYAYTSGIKLNDRITFFNNNVSKKFKVTGIFVDPPFCSAMMQPTEAFISPVDMSFFGDVRKIDYMLKLKFKDYSKSDKFIGQWEKKLGHPLVGQMIKNEQFKAMGSFLTNIASTIMLITAFIITIVILLVIVYSITSDIYGDYKTIGVLMALGFSRKAVKNIYLLQYGIIYVFSVVIGLLLSSFLTHSIMNVFLKSLGYSGISINLLNSFMIVLVTTALIIFLTVFVVARRASQVMPVEAINSGNAKLRSRNGANFNTLFQNFGSVNMMILKSLVTRRGQSIFIGIVATLMIFITLIITNSTRGIKDPEKFKEFAGVGKENVTITYENSDNKAYKNIYDKVITDKRVKEFYQVSTTKEGVICSQGSEGQKNTSVSILGYGVDNKNNPVFEGKNPSNNHEIAISVTLSKLYDKGIGDIIKVYIHGEKKSLIVSGIYSSSQNSGCNIRVKETLIKAVDPGFRADTFNIVLKNEKAEKQFIKDYKRIIGVKSAVSVNDYVKKITKFVLDGVNIAIILVNCVLWGILLIILFNVMTLNVIRERKGLGILKTLGFTPSYMKITLIAPIVIMSTVGALIGVLLLNIVGTSLMNGMYNVVGISQCPVLIGWVDILTLVGAYLGFVVISTYIPARKIIKISPRELITE